jgi:muramoyltetrapeptide carboxypeptidase
MRPLLQAGARIGVVAPAGIHDPARLERGLEIIRGYGHHIELFPDLLRPFRYLASDDEQRAGQLIEALSEPSWDAVWLARGGDGITRLLGRVEAALSRGALRPKPVLGFSDATALFAALHPYGLGPLVHAPVVHSLSVTEPGSIEYLFSLLRGEDPEDLVGETWVPGAVQGPVVGGNLCLLATLCGTPWQLDVRGCIVVIEEIGEAPYRVDRMLQQLWDAGGLRGAVGIAFGQFDGCTPAEGATYGLREVLQDAVAGLQIPVVGNLPIGHGALNRAFVWGSHARLQDGRLHFPRSV